jgi:hypothetical protein
MCHCSVLEVENSPFFQLALESKKGSLDDEEANGHIRDRLRNIADSFSYIKLGTSSWIVIGSS